ncbi:hypothetical protein, partial [Streptosporangium sp. NPDC048865]|uniref:hypothetical protein n=1 Tax=Streptosporangium sp. NPDC048865 TaxID=3155766 RepID=UPI00343DF2CF
AGGDAATSLETHEGNDMSTEILMEGADAYTSLAEVATVPGGDGLEAFPPNSWLTSPLCSIAYTIQSGC